ncbi:hypothetical protein ScPMuIL_015279 [Solemya velum]
MVSEWIACLDKRPSDRTGEDLDIIYSRLKDIKSFEKFHPLLLQQICYYGYYEDLDKGVTLFRQGDIGTNWYTVLSGNLEVHISETGDQKDAVALCTLGAGTSFGESILTNKPRHATVLTRDYTELIRVEQKDFKILWERNKQFMEGVITPLTSLTSMFAHHQSMSLDHTSRSSTRKNSSSSRLDDMPNPAAPITTAPSEKLSRAGHVLRTVLLSRAPQMIRDRKYHLRTYRRCMVGTEMVDWLLQQSSLVHSRNQAVGMWQALLEEGVIVHVCHEHQFKDKYLFYRFREDDQGVGTVPTHTDKKECEEDITDILLALAQIGPDAMMRMILRKPPHERTVEDLEIIYEELLHIKALSHLSTMVKRELASVLVFESHVKAGTVLFNQGDEGKSWYIILKGSVNVVIYGKGVVCTLHEGDDFGKLALVNDAPSVQTTGIIMLLDMLRFSSGDLDSFNLYFDVEKNKGTDFDAHEVMKQTGQQQTSHYQYKMCMRESDYGHEHITKAGSSKRVNTSLWENIFQQIAFAMSYHLCPHFCCRPWFLVDVLTFSLEFKPGLSTDVSNPVCLTERSFNPDCFYGKFKTRTVYGVFRFNPEGYGRFNTGNGSTGGKKKQKDVATRTVYGRCNRTVYGVCNPDCLRTCQNRTVSTGGRVKPDCLRMCKPDCLRSVKTDVYGRVKPDCLQDVYQTVLSTDVATRTVYGRCNPDCLRTLQPGLSTDVSNSSMVLNGKIFKKFTLLSFQLQEYQTLEFLFAIGWASICCQSTLTAWKLPGKFKKMFADFETLMDPSRNHRVYRLTVAKMTPPVIPFMPLQMKDMTFTHEGNKTYFDGLVNFEKMHMISQTIRTIRFCRSRHLDIELPSTVKTSTDVSNYIKNFQVIDNQRTLTQLSHKLEPRRT